MTGTKSKNVSSRSAREERAPAKGRTWQQTKSSLTRSAILDAALRCFIDLGYRGTTTEKVAAEAGVSRGAMLHHFPSRRALIQAAVVHLNELRLATYEADVPPADGSRDERIDAGIDAYWAQINGELFTITLELQVASRTDPELREVLLPALQTYEAAARSAAAILFPELAALPAAFEIGIALSRSTLQGMALQQCTRGDMEPQRIDTMLTELKAQLRGLYQQAAEAADTGS